MATLRQLTYRPADASAGDIEVLTFERLRQVNDGATQRADFLVVAVIAGGHGEVSIDFERYPLTPHTALRIPPGTVHRWDDIRTVDGRLVLCIPTAPVTRATRALTAPTAPSGVVDLAGDSAPVFAAFDHLELELRSAHEGVQTEIPALLLSALLARLPVPPGAVGSNHPLFDAFRDELEAHFRTHHDAGFYARRLGYAPRTLSRAVQQATGRTAKAYIVERLMLEAKRMLAHDRFTAARCARELGFADASGFSAFFRQHEGLPAGEWQKGSLPTDVSGV